jgi:hypothetical protein
MVHDHARRGVPDLLLDEAYALVLVQGVGDLGRSRIFGADVSGRLYFFQGWGNHGPVQCVPVKIAALLVHEHEIFPISLPSPFPLLAQRFDHKLRQFDIPN